MNTEQRIKYELERIQNGETLYELAEALKNEGISQKELYSLFDSFREKHATDTDGKEYNAILDTMDFIVGYCNQDMALFKDGEP